MIFRLAYLAMLPISVAIAATACNGDESGPIVFGGGGNGGAPGFGGASGSGGSALRPAVLACEAFCVTEDACDPETTVEECNSYRCSGFETASASCLSALKAFYDCMNVAADPCFTDRCAEQTAYHDACS
jgi:hypothetical protein